MPLRSLTSSRRVRIAAPLLAASVLLSGCGGTDGDRSPSGEETSAAPVPEFWPLTGLQAPEGTTTKLDRPPLVVKVDNTPSSSPQLGLSGADMVVEELVEGGITRLAAFFYTQLPKTVGPVRSMRASDIGIVTPVDADIITSGAAPVTIKRIKNAGIDFYGEGSKGMFRDDGRAAPYNLFTHLQKTATLATREPETVPDYLDWGTEAEYVGVEPVTKLSVPFSWSHTTEWAYDGTHYVNTNSNAKKGDQLKPDSVLVLRVRIGDAGYKDPAGNPVPETKFVGTGKALLFHAGQVVRGTWTKTADDAPLQLATTAGPLTVPAGHTWIELVPNDGPPLVMKP